ncbi:MAG: acyl-CoA synthetase (NDP forming) [Pseudorhodobacter sp.]|jgi:acyl-CoA synthetase (NDP forming)
MIGGLKAYSTLSDLPAAPDAAFIGVNRHTTVEIVAELSALGAGGAICFASGWTEAGEAGLQAALVQAAGEMPILGPNCYGMINYLDGALLWPDQHGGQRVARGVALLSQSSNIVINLTMQARGLPVAYVACLGNVAQVGLAELASELLADPRVTALGLYVEGIDDTEGFAALAEAARQAGKGIVCLKSGKTEASQTAAASHTAALAGGSAASMAFLRQAGVAEVNTLSELLETLKIFHVHGPQIGARLCSLSCSGGEAGLVADLAAPFGIAFPPPSKAQHSHLTAILGPMVTIANPLDYHTFIWGDGLRTTDVFSTMLAGYDAGIFLIDPPRPDRCDPSSFQPALDAIEAAAALTGKPAFPVASLPENFDETRAVAMMARGTVPLMGLESALGALRAAQTPPGRAGWRPWPSRCATRISMLDEVQAKQRLSQLGIAVPKGVSAPDLDELALLTAGLCGPLALKGLGFAHKSENGAVRLGLQDVAAQPDMPGATGYLAEEMVQGAVAELLLGLRHDPVYGVTMTLGFGGVTAELLADTVTLICPVVAQEVLAALQSLRLWPLLDGYRGRVLGDVAAVVDTALKMQAMMRACDVVEVEVNPLMVLSKGAIAVDAVIWEAEE